MGCCCCQSCAQQAKLFGEGGLGCGTLPAGACLEALTHRERGHRKLLMVQRSEVNDDLSSAIALSSNRFPGPPGRCRAEYGIPAATDSNGPNGHRMRGAHKDEIAQAGAAEQTTKPLCINLLPHTSHSDNLKAVHHAVSG
jgi:hypothetical protein